MNFEVNHIPHIHVVSPQPVFRPSNVDLETSPTTPREDVSLNHDTSNHSHNFLKIPLIGPILKGLLFLARWTGYILVKIKENICNNKVTAFLTIQTMFLFLKFFKIITPKTLVFLTFVPILVLLVGAVLHLCISAQRNANQIRRQQRQSQMNQNQNHIRRAQALEQLNGRIIEQMFANSENAIFNFMPAGNGGRIRFVHLDPNLSLNGTRTQLRLISRELLRLLADFIEEQQLQQARNQRSGLDTEQINSIPVEKYLIPLNGVDEPETCSICIDEFKQEQELRKLPCHHKFHLTCVDEWLKISNTCPNCKADLFPNGNGNNGAHEP